MKLIQTIKQWICSDFINNNKRCSMEKQHWIDKFNNQKEDYIFLINEKDNQMKELEDDLDQMTHLSLRLQNKLSEYTKDDKHLTLETFMDWLNDNVIEKNRTHRLNANLPNRIIRNSSVRPSTFLRDCVTEEEKPEILRFAKQVIGRRTHSNEDDLVRQFNIAFDSKYPTNRWYKNDIDYSGFHEYWATPMQTINYIRNDNHFGDCDNVSHLKYWCLTLLLNEHYPNWNKKRLRCFLVWVMGAYYHAKLAWVKEGVNDWIPIETTYMAQRFSELWDNDLVLRTNQIGYKINFSYDTEAEYEKI